LVDPKRCISKIACTWLLQELIEVIVHMSKQKMVMFGFGHLCVRVTKEIFVWSMQVPDGLSQYVQGAKATQAVW
jgi:hypothetical protein